MLNLKRFIAIASLSLAACAPDIYPPDNSTVVVLQPQGCTGSELETIRDAANAWNSLVGSNFTLDVGTSSNTRTLPVVCVDQAGQGIAGDYWDDWMGNANLTLVHGLVYQITVMHELGHAMGLQHENDSYAIMCPTSAVNLPGPDSTDYGQLCALYPQNEACTSTNLTGSLWPDPVANDPGNPKAF